MDARDFFDADGYFRQLHAANRMATGNGFVYCNCSGINTLEGVLDNFRTAGAFFCVDDTNDGALFQGHGGGWYKKRTFTVFLLHRYAFGDMADRAKALRKCRTLFRQVMSRMLIDADDMSNELVYLHTDRVLSRELGQYFINGCTGLYFMIDVSEPVDLRYDDAEWTE